MFFLLQTIQSKFLKSKLLGYLFDLDQKKGSKIVIFQYDCQFVYKDLEYYKS